MQLVYSQLSKIFTNVSTATLNTYLAPLNLTFDKYNISTGLRIAGFLSQIAVESEYFTHLSENLNYSAISLTKVFPSEFPTLEIANQYARQPEKIANRAYANRYGNGDEASGDGWRYRGQGLIQVTFFDNYRDLATAIGKSVEDTVAYIGTPEGACISAGWFWNMRGINQQADIGNIANITRKINPNLLGLTDRIRVYQLAKQVLGV